MLEKIVWNINDLCRALGRTEKSIRADLHRQNWNRTPPPTRLAGTLCWRPQDVTAWLELRAKESGAVFGQDDEIVCGAAQKRRRRPGRPSKNEKNTDKPK